MSDEDDNTETTTDPAGRIDELVMHWYCFSYAGIDIDSGNQCQACTYTGYSERAVSKLMIDRNKKNAGVTDSAVTVAVSYLGHMTRAEMLGA